MTHRAALRDHMDDVVRVLRLLLRTQLARFSRRRIGLSLVYHRVGPDPGHRGRELVPALGTRTFERHMRIVKLAFAPVPASALVDAVRDRRWGQRVPMAVTFDDDLGSHARIAVPALSRRKVPATFFLCGRVDGPTFWWDALQAAVDRGRIADILARADVPRSVAEAWTGRPESIHAVARALLDVAPPVRDAVSAQLEAAVTAAGVWDRDPPLTAAEMAMIAEAGFEIGFHTARHDFLPGLDTAALAAAVTDGHAGLRQLTGQPVSTLAYPHGGVNPAVAAATRAAGFTAAFTTAGEPVLAGQDTMTLGRLECLGSIGELAGILSRRLSASPVAARPAP